MSRDASREVEPSRDAASGMSRLAQAQVRWMQRLTVVRALVAVLVAPSLLSAKDDAPPRLAARGAEPLVTSAGGACSASLAPPSAPAHGATFGRPHRARGLR